MRARSESIPWKQEEDDFAQSESRYRREMQNKARCVGWWFKCLLHKCSSIPGSCLRTVSQQPAHASSSCARNLGLPSSQTSNMKQRRWPSFTCLQSRLCSPQTSGMFFRYFPYTLDANGHFNELKLWEFNSHRSIFLQDNKKTAYTLRQVMGR